MNVTEIKKEKIDYPISHPTVILPLFKEYKRKLTSKELANRAISDIRALDDLDYWKSDKGDIYLKKWKEEKRGKWHYQIIIKGENIESDHVPDDVFEKASEIWLKEDSNEYPAFELSSHVEDMLKDTLKITKIPKRTAIVEENIIKSIILEVPVTCKKGTLEYKTTPIKFLFTRNLHNVPHEISINYKCSNWGPDCALSTKYTSIDDLANILTDLKIKIGENSKKDECTSYEFKMK